jgi:uncharacterized protein YfaS (alpha-2-macroglobulin family)
MSLRHFSVRLLLLVLLLMAATGAHPLAVPGQTNKEDETENNGFKFRLSEGTPPAAKPEPRPAAPTPAKPLSAGETERLLSRLPAIGSEPADRIDFKLRPGSLPPPIVGQVLQAAFLPPASIGPPPPVAADVTTPLRVLRVAPEGEVGLAPALTITFSLPMVSVSSQAEAAAVVPVTLTPQPKGAWHWLGAQVLVFQPDYEGGRFPMATSYQVTIPAGTRSALGNVLAETESFTFSTPAPTIKTKYPTGQAEARDSIIFIEYDQRIDADRVFASIQQRANGLHFRRATAEEIVGDEPVRDLVKSALEGRWLAFRAVDAGGSTKDALPPDTDIQIVTPAGTASAEGSRVTAVHQTFGFHPFGPFRVTNTTVCFQDKCSPLASFDLNLSNQPDGDSFQPSLVTITPEIPFVKIDFSGNLLRINGVKKSNAEYTVTLDPAMKDIHGQALTGQNEFKFKTTTAPPQLWAANDGFMVMDPAVKGTFNFFSLNYAQVRVRLSRVSPEDWTQYRKYITAYRRDPKDPPPLPPGKLVFDRVLDLKHTLDELTESAIDLSPALTNGHGQVFVRIDGIEPNQTPETPVRIYASQARGPIEAWVQATDIGLDAFADGRSVVVWANSLGDGKPLAGVNIQVLPDHTSALSDASGLARPELKRHAEGAPAADQDQPALILARHGDDVAIMPVDAMRYGYYTGNSGWPAGGSTDRLAWYVFDDRNLYRPGEEVHVKGWIRKVNTTPTGDTELFAAAGKIVNYVLKDSQDNEISKGTATLNALAGFDLKLELPPTMNLGWAAIDFDLGQEGGDYRHGFQVQEFRRPEFEIKTETSDGPHLVGSSATVTATASYYTGGGLADTEVNWKVYSAPAQFAPPNREDYEFGKVYPWWLGDPEHEPSDEQTLTGKTNSQGEHTLNLTFDSVEPARPTMVFAEARVQDVNRQTISAHANLLVHPASLYVGLKPERNFIQAGKSFDLAAIVTDIDGKPVPGRAMQLRLVRLDDKFEKGNWVTKEVDPQEQTVNSGADGVPVHFSPSAGGEYKLTARVRDDRERSNETELTFWVAGGKLHPTRDVEQEKVQLIPDRRHYESGQTAEILVLSPFTPAEGVLTLRRSGLLRTERFTMTDNSYVVRIPIEDAMAPNLTAQVDLVGAETRVGDDGNARTDLPKRSAYASGEIDLDIPPASRRLQVTATPRDLTLEPGGETTVDVLVKDATGQPVAGTDTAVVVVDESVLALAGYTVTDPLKEFYPERSADVSDYHLRERLKLASPQEVESLRGELNTSDSQLSTLIDNKKILDLPLLGRDPSALILLAPGAVQVNTSSASVEMSVSGRSGDTRPIVIRRNFNALATFAASVPTDAEGKAQVKIRLPDNLTRYRVMAFSVSDGRRAGTGESVITARKQLMARPSAPRFLNFGDRAELPVVLQNQTSHPMEVNVAVRATNAELTEGAGRSVTIPANDRVEVRFPLAASLPGIARFQVAISSGKLSDAAEVSIPVYTPATTEAMATYGVIDQGAVAQPVKAPADAVRQYGGLEVTTASTQLQELTDAVIYLVHYPYECSEQISSRLLALAALKDVLTAFKSKDLPSPAAMQASVDQDLKRLQGLQNEDGGFGYWQKGVRSVPFLSVHVAHALVVAKAKGFTVPDEMLKNSKEYLTDIETKIPDDYSAESQWAIRAYALYVRNLMNDADPAAARQLIVDASGVEKLSLESLGWILPVLSHDSASASEVASIRRRLNNRVTETAGAAHFVDTYSDGAYTILSSDRRADGVLLNALIGDQPKSDLIPKLVRGLLGGRRNGHWLNTQENVFSLLALDRYFNTYEKAEPNFTARVWLGKDYAGEQKFAGRSVDKQQLNLPMADLADRTAKGPANLTIDKQGPGRLYYRIGTKYAPSSLNLSAVDYGFKVERTYEAVDDPKDVSRDSDGTWHIRAGARIRVRLKMSNQSARYHVALVDPLPAGLEVLNPELKGTEALPDADNDDDDDDTASAAYYWRWHSVWFDHQNLRDDRVEAFAYLLWEGEHTYSYFARATTPGVFVVPPTKAEEMYEPETFGRGQSDRVVVK